MKRPVSVAATLHCEGPMAQEASRTLRRNCPRGMIESVRNGFLPRVPVLSGYEFRLFFSLYFSKKIHEVGGKQVLKDGALMLPESAEHWPFTKSARSFQEDRDRGAERVGRGGREREGKFLLVSVVVGA